MDLREEYERFQKAQQEAPKLIAKAQAYGSTTSDRARAAAARRDADPERMLKKIAEARAKEARDIDRLVPSELQHALLALMRLEINNLLPHPLRGLTENFTDDEAPLAAKLDAQGQAYWGRAPEGGDSVYPHTLSVVSVESQKIICSSGWWTHINKRYEIADKTFWFGPANECDDEWIWLPGGYKRCYVFVEVPSSEWSYTTDTDALYGGSTYMRRCIFSARISLHQEISELIVHNAGDIYT